MTEIIRMAELSDALNLIDRPLHNTCYGVAVRWRKIREQPQVHLFLQGPRHLKKVINFVVPGWSHMKVIGCAQRFTIDPANRSFELDAFHREASNQLGNASRHEFNLGQYNRRVNASAVESESNRSVVTVRLVWPRQCQLITDSYPELCQIQLGQEDFGLNSGSRTAIDVVTRHGKNTDDERDKHCSSRAYGRPGAPIDSAGATQPPAFRDSINHVHAPPLNSAPPLTSSAYPLRHAMCRHEFEQTESRT